MSTRGLTETGSPRYNKPIRYSATKEKETNMIIPLESGLPNSLIPIKKDSMAIPKAGRRMANLLMTSLTRNLKYKSILMSNIKNSSRKNQPPISNKFAFISQLNSRP